MILRVGLTGGIASGKSTVAKILSRLGCFVVDTDRVVRDLYRPGQPGYEAIVAQYGPGIVGADGEIDRVRLSSVALASDETARVLNGLIHPLVATSVKRIVAEEASRTPGDLIAVVEATLLIEAGQRSHYDRLIVVDVPRETQVERAVSRGVPREEAERRIDRQMSRQERLGHADYVIRNEGDAEALEKETRKVYDLLRADLTKRKEERGERKGDEA